MRTLTACVIVATTLSAVVYSEELDVPDYRKWETEEILKWETPASIKQDYPYYLAGFDEEDSPIWVSELGKWDTRKSADGTPERLRDYKKNIIQMFRRMVESVKTKSTADSPVTEFNLIFDMEGFDIRQSGSASSLQLLLWIARQAEQAFSDGLKHVFILNSNYIFSTVYDLMKPILGRSLYKVEVFGNNKQLWISKVLKKFPKDQIPEWYGGNPDHKPLAIYG